jgi:hypothetical protein
MCAQTNRQNTIAVYRKDLYLCNYYNRSIYQIKHGDKNTKMTCNILLRN